VRLILKIQHSCHPISALDILAIVLTPSHYNFMNHTDEPKLKAVETKASKAKQGRTIQDSIKLTVYSIPFNSVHSYLY